MRHYSPHANGEPLSALFPLVEVDGFTVVAGGRRTAVNFEGVDITDFSATDAGGVVTGAFGLRCKGFDWLRLGAANWAPATGRRGVRSRYELTQNLVGGQLPRSFVGSGLTLPCQAG
ncbi:MAG: hypothetical protein FJX68_09235 [Alphaproteobacteria bacterium]|nr:hypothetical protein [Alphaproteobacteria bacterium]